MLEEGDLNHSVVVLILTMVLLSAAALVIIVLAIIAYLRRTMRPIDAVMSAADSIMEGRLDIELESASNDELGQLSRTLVEMAANLKEIVVDVKTLLGEMSQGNLRIHAQCEERYVGEYREILLAVREINRGLSHTMYEINTAADQVNMGSEQVSSGAQALSQGFTEQAAAVEELSATIAEITNQIKENADNAIQASSLSQEAGMDMADSNQRMEELMAAMEEISNTSNEISKIIKTIADIAFQTNILALNAAVEAARAGAAGKGFAVVADEVRNLAAKSADAAKNTTAFIENTVNAIANGTTLAENAAGALHAVVEKATGAAQITTGIDQISSAVQTNSATAQESAAASEVLSSQAQMLKDLVDTFQLRDEDLQSGPPQRPAPRQPPVTEPEPAPDYDLGDKY